jgi:hypothetical protein
VGRILTAPMRSSESRPSRVRLDAPSVRRPHPLAADDAPFGALIGVLVGILISLPLWALIVLAVMVLRRS